MSNIDKDIELYDEIKEFYKKERSQLTYQKFEEMNAMITKRELIYRGKKQTELDISLEHYTAYLHDLEDGWDGQNARRFSTTTIKRSKSLVIKIMDYFTEQRIDFFKPKILPVPNGSLDISWKDSKLRLIINIPRDESRLIEIYGDFKDHPEDEIDCRLNYEIVGANVIEWFKKILRYGR